MSLIKKVDQVFSRYGAVEQCTYQASIEFAKRAYLSEDFPIFEHSSYHIYGSLAYQYKLFTFNSLAWSGIIAVNDTELFIFTPYVRQADVFYEECLKIKHDLQSPGFVIKNVSECFFNSLGALNVKFSIVPRSLNEVVYEADVLAELSGKQFAKLRHAYNKYITAGRLHFEDVNPEKISDVESVHTKWHLYQSGKYHKDRKERELYTIRCFADLSKNPDLIFRVGYLNSIPVSIIIMHRAVCHSEWMVSYLIKGINNKEFGGAHGISDATYCYAFKLAKQKGIKWINDGDLGTEIGSSTHKLKFKPKLFLKSFDIIDVI